MVSEQLLRFESPIARKGYSEKSEKTVAYNTSFHLEPHRNLWFIVANTKQCARQAKTWFPALFNIVY